MLPMRLQRVQQLTQAILMLRKMRMLQRPNQIDCVK
jgi:hypothetical protein